MNIFHILEVLQLIAIVASYCVVMFLAGILIASGLEGRAKAKRLLQVRQQARIELDATFASIMRRILEDGAKAPLPPNTWCECPICDAKRANARAAHQGAN